MARTLGGLGTVAHDQGDLAAAKEYHRQALTLKQKLAPDSVAVANSLHELGLLAHEEGDLPTARAYHERALDIYQRRAPDSLDVANSLTALSAVLHDQGDLARARSHHHRALALREKLAPGSLEVAGSLMELGMVAQAQGDLAAAKEYHQRALALKQKLAPGSFTVAKSLSNLGAVTWAERHLAAARDYFRQALEIYEQKAPDSPRVAGLLTNLGLLAYVEEDLPAARAHLRRALDVYNRLAPDSLPAAAALHNLGLVVLEFGDLTGAQKNFREALALRERLAPGSRDVASSLGVQALVALGLGRLQEAEGWARQAWELERRQAGVVTGDEARRSFEISAAAFAALLIDLQLALGKPEAAFLTLEEGRAQALQQLLLERHLDVEGAPADLRSAYRAAAMARDRAEQAVSRALAAETRARRSLVDARFQGADPDTIARTEAAVEAAQKQAGAAQSTYTVARAKADQLWAEIRDRAPRALPPPLSLEVARRNLPPRSLFVAFSVAEGFTEAFTAGRAFREYTSVFLLRSGDGPEPALTAYRLALSSKELRVLAKTFRALVTDPRSDVAATVAAGRELFTKLFPEEARQAVEQAQRLVISPDGPLWEVPFAALVTNAQGSPRYLGADKPITHTQSLTLFAQARKEPPQLAAGSPAVAVVVGNPVFERQSGRIASTEGPRGERGSLFGDGRPPDPLPGTRQEAEEIATLYGVDPLMEERATEAALRARIERADVIHLATHGYLHPVRAMASGVLLAVPEREAESGETADDGALQAWEIYSQLRLKAELVVLSACETGRGELVRGEGVIGLTRALQYAGARAIVASQWKVADASTATLMVAFHRFLRQGVGKDEALRRAMAVLRQDARTAHPYYWGPFFLVGDPDNPNLASMGGQSESRSGVEDR